MPRLEVYISTLVPSRIPSHLQRKHKRRNPIKVLGGQHQEEAAGLNGEKNSEELPPVTPESHELRDGGCGDRNDSVWPVDD